MVEVTKRFGGITAVDGVSLNLVPGRVHAVVGENGAGKSTLMKLMDGLYAPDSGHVELDSQPIQLRSPHEAKSRGIAMIPQELELFEDLSVTENLYVGRHYPRRRNGTFDWGAMRRTAHDVLASMEADIDVEAPVRSLSAANKQIVEIGRALIRDARIHIMDEPTAALTDKEANNLFRLVRRLTAQGVAVVYISHRLAEIFALADDLTVLRDGKVVAQGPAANFDTHSVVRHMLGRELVSFRRDHESGDAPAAAGTQEAAAPTLELYGLTSPGAFHDIDLTVAAGEIVVMTGLLGSGRTEVVESLLGLRPISAGSVLIAGREVRPRNPREAKRVGIAHVPEERRSQGLVLPLSIRENLALANLDKVSKLGVIDRKKERAYLDPFAGALDVRGGSLTAPVGRLSGGNQQKVVIARALATGPEILILDEPTRGVDVGAKREIYDLIEQQAANGRAVLVISSDVAEVQEIAHRVIVMRNGAIAEILEGAARDEATIVASVNGPPALHTDDPVESTLAGSSGFLRRLLLRPEIPAAATLVLLMILLSASTDRFLTVPNLLSVADQVAVVGIIALAVNQVILAGEIDISVGSVLALLAFVAGSVAMGSGGGLVVPLALAVGLGMAIGATTGVFATWGRIPSIIVTLAVLTSIRGLVLARDASSVLIVPAETRALGRGVTAGLPRSVWILLAVAAIMQVVSTQTRWGRNVLAVGGNAEAARLAGLAVHRVRFYAFVLVGGIVGIASIVFLGQIGQVQATAAVGLELQVIAAVVIGGTSIVGGVGSNWSPVLGALLVGAFLNALILLRVPATWMNVVLGALILAAVVADGLRRRLVERFSR